ncbi:MAG: Cytochrome c oxidase polypeptide [Micavibrio sp.]|nr:Cytochrome c oxidase polypeptide [Micavibrio sp.]
MTIMNMSRFVTFLSLFALALFALPSLGLAVQPVEWQMNFQEAATPVAERLHNFHHFLLYIISGICLFVLALLLYVIIRFNAKTNPVPSATTHNVLLEIIWTVVPVVILIVIAVPSFKLLYYADRTDKPEMTLKVTGYQWYWGYEYPDNGGISFNANMVPSDQINKGENQSQVPLLSTDHPVVLPIDTNIQILVTGQDVIHSFAVPSFGVKTDAVPGRTNETWVRITKPGTYYGQCDQLCGTNHAFMPIEVFAVTKEEFAKWVANQNEGKTPAKAAGDKPADKKAAAETAAPKE